MVEDADSAKLLKDPNLGVNSGTGGESLVSKVNEKLGFEDDNSGSFCRLVGAQLLLLLLELGGLSESESSSSSSSSLGFLQEKVDVGGGGFDLDLEV